MVTLVDPKQPEEVCRCRVSRSAALAFPEGSVEVVALTDNGALADVKGLGERLEMNEASS